MESPANPPDEMVAHLRRTGVLHSDAIEHALRSVPREVFVPDVSLDEAYADHAILVKHSSRGVPLSSASQPSMVTAMLEELRVEPGHLVLEIGAGTGYNAALLGVLVGPNGRVVSVELEADLADAARSRLAERAPNVEVVTGDGTAGHEALAPYDRVIVTTGPDRVAPAWTAQLRDGGRMVVPLVEASSGVGAVKTYDKLAGALVERASLPCAFIPMR